MNTRINRFHWIFLIALLLTALPSSVALAQSLSPVSQAEVVRSELLKAQFATESDTGAAQAALDRAIAAYEKTLSPAIAPVVPAVDDRVRAALATTAAAIAAGNTQAVADARAWIWTGVLDGAYQVVIHSIQTGDNATAQAWLLVREFRQATRFSRPNADATLAVDALANGATEVDLAVQAVRSDLMDTYQARLNEALHDLAAVDAQGFAIRRADLAGLAEGYFAILQPAYAEQRGADAAQNARQGFQALRTAARTDKPMAGLLEESQSALRGFRAAPLSPEEVVRRTGQMMRFLSLVPIEYRRGIRNGQVASDLEIREAITFHEGASAAFKDLEPLVDDQNPVLTSQAAALFMTLERQLVSASAHTEVVGPATLQATTDELVNTLDDLLPSEWRKQDGAADFDVIDTALDQMEKAVAAGEYGLAESARLEAYAILESGPEARLVAFVPQYVAVIEDLFWYGQGDRRGLAYLIDQQASYQEISALRADLDVELEAAQTALGGQAAPGAIALNAAIIVFREGLEAVVILAALMASLVGVRRIFRKPMIWGVVLAFAASGITWWLMQTILSSFRGYGERLEAVVSLIAIGVLLLITNWFFHRIYWTGWMADLHSRKKNLMGDSVAGQILGFLILGFTSVYREGFETVLFLQALVLDAGVWTVLQGVALGMAGVLAVGWLTFRFQSRLPYKRMLVVTGVFIAAVLLVMVGNTVHIMQVVGWMPIHPLRWLTLPFWTGLWLGVFPTWEGLALQVLSAVFVLGSYFLAGRQQKQQTRQQKEKTLRVQQFPVTE